MTKPLESHNKIRRFPSPALCPDCASKIYAQLPREEQDLSVRASQASSGRLHGQISLQRPLATPPLQPGTWLQPHPNRSMGFGGCFQARAGSITHTQPTV